MLCSSQDMALWQGPEQRGALGVSVSPRWRRMVGAGLGSNTVGFKESRRSGEKSLKLGCDELPITVSEL